MLHKTQAERIDGHSPWAARRTIHANHDVDPVRRQQMLFALSAMMSQGLPAMEQHSPPSLEEHVSDSGFASTLETLTLAIRAAGLKVFATIDHAAEAAKEGLRMPRTVVLIYGNPKSGTPLMLVAPSVALDLPLRVLVRAEGDDRTVVTFHPVVEMLTNAGIPEVLARRIAPAQQLLVDALRA